MVQWYQVSSPLNNAKSSLFFVWKSFWGVHIEVSSEHYKIRVVWTMRWRIASTCCLLAYFVLHYWWYHKGVNGAESAPSGSLVQLSLWIASMSVMHIIVSLLVTAFNTSTDLISSSYLISFPRDLGVRVVFYHLLFLSPYLHMP